ncbi:hypothetical protein [Deinococcus geothermalis]|nr:hypothetical protein [Deinococcus geothermalis]
MIGQVRHSLMEQEMRALGRRGDISQLSAKDEQLRSRRGCIKPGSYVAIHYGNVLITQSHTDVAEQLPPEALFRKNNARLNQWTLEESIEGSGPQRYIVVTHGPTKENPEELGFIQAGFLHPNGHKYVYQYDLLKLPVSQIIGVIETTDDIEIKLDIIEEAKEEGEEG